MVLNMLSFMQWCAKFNKIKKNKRMYKEVYADITIAAPLWFVNNLFNIFLESSRIVEEEKTS